MFDIVPGHLADVCFSWPFNELSDGFDRFKGAPYRTRNGQHLSSFTLREASTMDNRILILAIPISLWNAFFYYVVSSRLWDLIRGEEKEVYGGGDSLNDYTRDLGVLGCSANDLFSSDRGRNQKRARVMFDVVPGHLADVSFSRPFNEVSDGLDRFKGAPYRTRPLTSGFPQNGQHLSSFTLRKASTMERIS
ncbi:hypothetical protein CEXT_708151 [Caerostris extrusa]|uniref:Uncharacterized protein n=1 Tax=Caerostris extrusa TaxID=172846 RepID=A0AAV4NDZ3_CAEEX|nr:hypothetical protein CEXT_708151 [Caerostris extrusa]